MTEQQTVDVSKVGGIVDKWKRNPHFLIEILQDTQEEYHYLPKEVLKELSNQIQTPITQIFHIATFFKGLSLVPRGKHLIQVCMGTACHVEGAPKIIDQFQRELNVKVGNTTKDYKYSLEAVRCLGCCGLAAVVTVGSDLHGQVTAGKVTKILKKYG
ncbi:MAG: NAD(P)H-dependent oxidoreductase subunit E [Bacteroidota bacterium]|nr:NAD(P)H-dependent oxidoreductase subunit E [Bacteroidota bacterium]